MKPPGTPVASVIISELHTQLRENWPTAYLEVFGRGILTPGVQIPNEWWDHPRLVYDMRVDKPQVTANGVLAVNFKCRCQPENILKLQAIADSNVRETIERKVVPPLLVQLGIASWPSHPIQPLAPAPCPFGTPVDWDTPSPPTPPRRPLIDLVMKLVLGQDSDTDRELVLQQVADHGMLAPEHLAALATRAGLPPPAVADGGVVVRRPRVRVVDV